MSALSFYKLADFLGFAFEVDKQKITGTGKIRMDIGLCKLDLVATIKYGRTNLYHTHAAIFIQAGLDLCVGVLSDLETNKATVLVFDRRYGPSLKMLEAIDVTKPEDIKALFQTAKPRYFEGTIGKPFKAVTVEA